MVSGESGVGVGVGAGVGSGEEEKKLNAEAAGARGEKKSADVAEGLGGAARERFEERGQARRAGP